MRLIFLYAVAHSSIVNFMGNKELKFTDYLITNKSFAKRIAIAIAIVYFGWRLLQIL